MRQHGWQQLILDAGTLNLRDRLMFDACNRIQNGLQGTPSSDRVNCEEALALSILTSCSSTELPALYLNNDLCHELVAGEAIRVDSIPVEHPALQCCILFWRSPGA